MRRRIPTWGVAYSAIGENRLRLVVQLCPSFELSVDTKPFMSTPLLICDDSKMARKQVARSLPDSLDADISFASNGIEALQAIRNGLGDIVFLDLTMPEMDGYQVLEAIAEEQLKSVVIVISGDIQPTARERVTSLGALDFIKKPVNADALQDTLRKFGLI